jgi:DNA-binding Xre family transcriptional regulator
MSVKQLARRKTVTNSAYSKLPELLAQHHSSVADLYKRLSAKGISFDRKTLYRLASAKPLASISTPVLRAVCEEFLVGIGDILVWEPPQPKLHRIDERMQERLSILMAKNNEDELTDQERDEFQKLGAEAERLSLENARILAAAARSRTVATPRTRPVARKPKTVTSRSRKISA